MSEAFETNARALTFQAPGLVDLVLPGPNAAGVEAPDISEAYYYELSQVTWDDAGVDAWIDAFIALSAVDQANVTLTLDDGLTSDISPTTPFAAGATSLSSPVVSKTDILTLDRFDSEGLDTDVLALIEISDTTTLYAVPPRGSFGTLVDGELGLSDGPTDLTRIFLFASDELRFNDNNTPASLVLSDYFSGDGSDLTLYIQTLDGVANVSIEGNYIAGGNFVSIQTGNPIAGLLGDLSVGDRFIIALARPEVLQPVSIVTTLNAGVTSLSSPTVTILQPISIGTTLNVGDASLSSPTVTTEGVALLSLSDFDDSGLEVDWAAVLEKPSGNDLLNDANLVEGEVGYGPNDFLIESIFLSNETTVWFLDNVNGSLNGYVASVSDLRFYAQTSAGVEYVEVNTVISLSGSTFVSITLTDALAAIISGLVNNQRFILAWATPIPGVGLSLATAFTSGVASLSSSTVSLTAIPQPISIGNDSKRW